MSRLTPLWTGLLGWLAVSSAVAQNLEAGKSPAQIFSDTCASCHRSPRELKHPSASFMREHYTTSAEMASAMAGYLAGFPTETRAAQPKQPAGAAQGPAETSRSRRSATEQGSGPEGQGAAPGHRVPGERAGSPDVPAAGRQASNPRRPTASAEAVKPALPSVEEPKPAANVEPPKPVLPDFEE